MSKHLCYIWVKFSLSCSRKCLRLSIYILLKQNSIPAASLPSPSLSGKRPHPASERLTLSQLSLISWDQLVIAADTWLRGQRSCREPLYEPECMTGRRLGNAGARLPSFHASMGKQWASLGGSQVSKKRCNFQKGKKKKKQQWPDTDSGCSVKPSWTDRGQWFTSVFSGKQNKRPYLGGIAVDGCGVSTLIKSRSDATGTTSDPSLQLRGCTTEELILRPMHTALTESWNNSPGRTKIAENKHHHRTELIPPKSLYYRQDTHLVTSLTIAHCLPRQLMSSRSHFSLLSHAALNINSADNCLETVSARHSALNSSRTLAPQRQQVVNLHDKQKKGGRTKVSAMVKLWLGNFSFQISAFPDPDFTEAFAQRRKMRAPPGFWQRLI